MEAVKKIAFTVVGVIIALVVWEKAIKSKIKQA